jgi:hypothetical protein
VVQTTFIVSGDVSSFDADGFRVALHGQFPEAQDVVLTIQPASIGVEAKLIMATEVAAEAVAHVVTTTPVSTMQSTWFANVNDGAGVLIQSAPSVSIVEELVINPPPPLPISPSLELSPPGTPPSSGNLEKVPKLTASDWILMIVGICALAASLGAGGYVLRRRCVAGSNQAREKVREKAKEEAREEVRADVMTVIEAMRATTPHDGLQRTPSISNGLEGWRDRAFGGLSRPQPLPGPLDILSTADRNRVFTDPGWAERAGSSRTPARSRFNQQVNLESPHLSTAEEAARRLFGGESPSWLLSPQPLPQPVPHMFERAGLAPPSAGMQGGATLAARPHGPNSGAGVIPVDAALATPSNASISSTPGSASYHARLPPPSRINDDLHGTPHRRMDFARQHQQQRESHSQLGPWEHYENRERWQEARQNEGGRILSEEEELLEQTYDVYCV